MDEPFRAGVDIGGTFTDVVTVDNGRVATHKTPSTPQAPEEAVRNGLQTAADAGDLTLADLNVLVHGTTVGTNAVLEESFAKTALLTTEGFRDVLEIGRQSRPDIYDHDAEKPSPVVPRHRRHEVTERRDERGGVITPLTAADVRDTVRNLDDDVESVAVSFLFAFENDAHEQRVADIIREERDIPVSLSGTVLPEIREYERTLATAINAALRPIVEEYIEQLRDDLSSLAPTAGLRVMGSNGGAMTAETARKQPVRTLLSGPAAGVRGAAYVGNQSGFTNVLTMDMGGTSCDVSLVQDGDPTVSTGVTVGDYPVSLPMVDVHTVGSGGGSIAWLDSGNALRVGPRSAGARPGPVCYGRGGDAPTTTDAHVLLGRIDPTNVFDDPAPRSAVEAAMTETIGDPLDRTPREAAQAVLRVANATMERALRVVSVERGHDPRDLTLVAYGGAGPLHATALASALSIPRVLIPPAAGVLSALGLLASDLQRDFSRSRVRPLSEVSPQTLEETFRDLENDAQDALAAADIPHQRRSIERALDLRYEGQTYDLTIPIKDDFETAGLTATVDRFHDRHHERYGHADKSEPVELVTIRVRARGRVNTPNLDPPSPGGTAADAIRDERAVTVGGAVRETPIYDRDQLPRGATVDGPAVIEGGQSTTLIREDEIATVDPDTAGLIIEVPA